MKTGKQIEAVGHIIFPADCVHGGRNIAQGKCKGKEIYQYGCNNPSKSIYS